MLLLQQMLAMFLMMLVGFFCGKIKALNQSSAKTLSWIVVNVANPAMVLASGMDNDEPVEMQKIVFVIGLSVLVYMVLMLLAMITPRMFRVRKNEAGVYKVMLIFSNIGFMGMPLLSALYGGESLLYVAMFFFPFNILIYTYGIHAMKKKDAVKEPFRIQSVFNIGVNTSILALIIYFARIPVPDFLVTATKSFNNITAPLSMLVIGLSFLNYNLKELFTDVRLLLFSAWKLLVLPIVGTFLIMQFVPDKMICCVCMIVLATPVGSMTAMLAQQYDGDYELASKGVALTTILSVITMPIVSTVLGL